MDVDLISILWLICFTCVLPILATWFNTRVKINKTNKEAQIIIAAMEKNPEINPEEMLKATLPKRAMIKEKLLAKMQRGIICIIVGSGIIAIDILAVANNPDGYNSSVSLCIGGIIIAIGIALIANFFIGKKFLAKEIAAEETQKIQQQ